MAKDKKGFIMYADQKELFDTLTEEQAGKLIKHIFAYVNDENPESDDILTKLAFIPIKQQLKRDLKKFEETKQSRSDAGKKGMESRWKNNKAITKHNKAILPITKITDTVNVNVKENVKEKVIKNKYLECIFISDLEYKKLITKFGELRTKEKLQNLNDYIMSKGVKYKSHYHTVLMWSKDELKKQVAS